jgi:hypothetical protein
MSYGGNISISDSTFKGCKSSRQGGVIYYEGQSDGGDANDTMEYYDNFEILRSSFEDNFANVSATIHLDAQNLNVNISEITSKHSSALFENAFG